MSRALRLGSFNLFSGRSLRAEAIDPGAVAAAIGLLSADVLALQEVDCGQPRSGLVDQAGVAAAAMGAVDHRYLPLVDGTPGVPGWRAFAGSPEVGDGVDGEGDAGRPSYGIALLSGVPVASWHVLHLDPARGRYPIPIPGGGAGVGGVGGGRRRPRVLWLPDEPRAVLAAVLEEPRLTVACTHLSFVPGVNVRQLRQVRRRLEQLPGPRILLGDLNLPGSLPTRLTQWTPLFRGPTYPAPAPRVQLDHALADGLPAGWHAQGSALELPISDHRAVLIDLAPTPIPLPLPLPLP